MRTLKRKSYIDFAVPLTLLLYGIAAEITLIGAGTEMQQLQRNMEGLTGKESNIAGSAISFQGMLQGIIGINSIVVHIFAFTCIGYAVLSAMILFILQTIIQKHQTTTIKILYMIVTVLIFVPTFPLLLIGLSLWPSLCLAILGILGTAVIFDLAHQ